MNSLLAFSPRGGGKGQQKREDLESPKQHGKGEHPFAENAVLCKISCGTDGCKAGADIIKAGSHSREVGFHTNGLKGDEQKQDEKAEHIDGKIVFGMAERVVIQSLSFKLDTAHRTGMQQLGQLQFGRAEQDNNTGDFKTAARGTGAGTDKHQHQ